MIMKNVRLGHCTKNIMTQELEAMEKMSSYKINQCNIINISILDAYQDFSCRIYFYSYCNSQLNLEHADYHSPIGGRC